MDFTRNLHGVCKVRNPFFGLNVNARDINVTLTVQYNDFNFYLPLMAHQSYAKGTCLSDKFFRCFKIFLFALLLLYLS